MPHTPCITVLLPDDGSYPTINWHDRVTCVEFRGRDLIVKRTFKLVHTVLAEYFKDHPDVIDLLSREVKLSISAYRYRPVSRIIQRIAYQEVRDSKIKEIESCFPYPHSETYFVLSGTNVPCVRFFIYRSDGVIAVIRFVRNRKFRFVRCAKGKLLFGVRGVRFGGISSDTVESEHGLYLASLI